MNILGFHNIAGGIIVFKEKLYSREQYGKDL